MDWEKTLCKLTEAAPHDMQDCITAALSKCAQVSVSPLGNIYSKIQGESQYTVLVDAHIDEIHMLVTGIDADGFVLVDSYGGIDRRTLQGSEVTVWGEKPLFGVFCITPPHLRTDTGGQLPPIGNMGIDVGLNRQQAMELIRPGDTVTLRAPFTALHDGRYTGKSLDNRAGAAILLRLGGLIAKADKPLPVTVVLQFSQMEEAGTGFVGGVTGANTWQPDEVLVIDAGFAAYPGSSYATPGQMGQGTMIGISPVLSRSISDRLRTVADEQTISYVLDVAGGRTGTNADRMTTVGCGIPTGLLSYPLQNMHTAVEMVDKADLEATARLLFAYLQAGGIKND